MKENGDFNASIIQRRPSNGNGAITLTSKSRKIVCIRKDKFAMDYDEL